MDEAVKKGEMSVSAPTDETAVIQLTGRWKRSAGLPGAGEALGILESRPLLRKVSFNTAGITEWDSSLLTFFLRIRHSLEIKGVVAEADGLPDGARRLLRMAAAVPERPGARAEAEPAGVRQESFLSRVGGGAISLSGAVEEAVAFIGEAALGFFALVRGRGAFRPADVYSFVQGAGVQALPIVSVIGMLVGSIFAFMGAIQLRTFGAQIYVADLVGIAMVRVMGAVMTGVIMAGRTGAAYAAQLGAMQVNEEIDALRTFGISPVEFLVAPRVIALTLMMPFLCVYADFMGILGGLIVGAGMLDLSAASYIAETRSTLDLTNLWIGLFHSFVFGIIISLTGCLRGMQCGRSASAVGDAATSAVVTAIVWMVIATAAITYLCDLMGI
ncbi:MAG: ABC transporter permease [Syntrophales bacterium]|nr:ABC transporter permease [Syntrophales bacterium]MDD5533560.1 ABC transporter permease [Syntrophales bacterium]